MDRPSESPWGGIAVGVVVTAVAIGWLMYRPAPTLTLAEEAAWAQDWNDSVRHSLSSGRPAIVLFTADWCPGCRCSVLTVTSPFDGLSGAPMQPSRAIARWRDREVGTREIVLPEGADAVVLTLVEGREEEWTADGRGDGRVTGCVSLGGTHFVPTDQRRR